MVGVVDVDNRVLKHYAQDTITHRRYIVIALENETDPNTCSVIDMDALEPDIRSELVALVNSYECQSQIDIWRILDKKFFMDYPKGSMLKVLQAMKQIKVLPCEQVAVRVPSDQMMTAKDVANAIREYKGQGATKPVKVDAQPRVETNAETVAQVEPVKPVVTEEMTEVKEGLKEINANLNALAQSLAVLVQNMGAQVTTPAPKKKKK